MLVYFDESYKCKDKLLLGALFLPTKNGRKWIHRQFTAIKNNNQFIDKNGVVKEIKYNNLTNSKKLLIAKQSIDLFVNSIDSYFRVCVVPYDKKQLDRVGRTMGIPRKIKEAMLYTHATVQLIKNHLSSVRKAVLLMDKITRAKGDRFDEMIINKLGSGKKAIFSKISYVDSSAPTNHTIQLCDLLLGSVLNENYPTKQKNKNEFRRYLKKRLNIPSLKESYWGNKSQAWAENKHPKFIVRYWGVPYQYLKIK